MRVSVLVCTKVVVGLVRKTDVKQCEREHSVREKLGMCV